MLEFAELKQYFFKLRQCFFQLVVIAIVLGIKLQTLHFQIVLFPAIEALPILLPDDKNEFDRYRCGEAFLQPSHGQLPKVCLKYLQSIGAYVNQGAYKCDCDPTGSKSFECSSLGGQCECKPNVVGRQCDMCAPGTYGFGPEGCAGKCIIFLFLELGKSIEIK